MLPHTFFISGKGGSGKSTLARALATALGARRAVTLVTLAGDDDAVTALSQGRQTGSGQDARFATARIDFDSELAAFIERLVPLRALSRRLLRSRTFNYVSAALPGLRALLTLERIRLLAQEAEAHGGVVVVDAPATGGALELLDAPRAIAALGGSGALAARAHAVAEFMGDPLRFQVLLAARPEEASVHELLEAVRALARNRPPMAATAVLNGVVESLLGEDEIRLLHRDETLDPATMRALELHAVWAAQAQLARRALCDAGVPFIETPLYLENPPTAARLARLGRHLLAGLNPRDPHICEQKL